MCTGLLMLRYVYGSDWLHGIISSLVTYLICLVAPRKHVHLYVFGWAMGYMTFSHLYRMIFYYMVDQFDFTRTQMVLTMKLTSFAYNLYDGSYIDNNVGIKGNVDAKNLTPNGKMKINDNVKILDSAEMKKSHLNGEEKNNSCAATTTYDKRILAERTVYAISDLPSPLEFGGFVFCFPNLLAGPAFAYKNYIDGIENVIQTEEINTKNKYRDDDLLNVNSNSKNNNNNSNDNNNNNNNDNNNSASNLLINENSDILNGMVCTNGKNGKKSILKKNEINELEIQKDNSNKNENSNVNNNSSVNEKEEENEKEKDKMKSSILPALKRLFVGVGSLIIFFIISSKAPIKQQYDKEWQNSHTFLYRIIFISISFLGERFKFYFAWKVSEGSCILGGFGYEKKVKKNDSQINGNEKVEKIKKTVGNGIKEGGKEMKKTENEIMKNKNVFENLFFSDDWRGVENIDILSYEFGTNIQSLSRAWNKKTQSWLEKYVYQRTNRSLLCTYATSALWHGLYPGFFMFFFAAALMSATERLVRTKINPLVLTDPSDPFSKTILSRLICILYTTICWFLTSITLTYHAQTFYMRSFERSYGAFKSFYFIPNIIFFIFYFLLELAPTPKKKIFKENNNKKND